ncbi:uncharacterized protein LOC129299088 [Prosopis cineraria]|uniref:uncharacterized protein LOC129295602 n=1 Tax=Prosopis cineraria TaxID=364024 RepID=UPI00240F6213|nr:uncharacterized protein LOC129295602 [Prosopis cineraria]XP_054793502.1 uncharacterized protein LOC129299088 [Prosopis cineraria]
MWGFGGRFYWGQNLVPERAEGIVVVFAWMSSDERHLNKYVDLYSSIGWNSLICHSQFLNMFFPEKATSLAANILNELVKVLRIRPCPIVFASFSGGAKACMFEVLQIIEGKCEGHNKVDYQLVRDSISGYIYDSSPVDFTSDLGARFLLHPSVLKMSHPPRFASWIANGIASGLDALFLSRFESQRAEYWQTLYSTIRMQAPYLIFCSENDDLAHFQVISNFVQRLKDLGCDVKMVKWDTSPHVGHYRHHPIDYKAAVTEILGKAATIYISRKRPVEDKRLGIEGAKDGILHPINNFRKAATTSTSFQGFAVASDDWLSGSMNYYEGKRVGSVPDERKEGLIHLRARPSINAYGVLGQALFDICVPENVEDWDIRSNSKNARSFAGTRRHGSFNPIKCIWRSRL